MFPMNHGRQRDHYIVNGLAVAGPLAAGSMLNGGGLLPEKLLGEQDPEAEQTNEGSGGDEDFHELLLTYS